jgi:hypothetical protein
VRTKPREVKGFAPVPEGRRVPAGQGQNRPLISPTFAFLARAQVAQSVEQWIENPRVGSSILSLGTISAFADVRHRPKNTKYRS